jgi:hypothetical protein
MARAGSLALALLCVAACKRSGPGAGSAPPPAPPPVLGGVTVTDATPSEVGAATLDLPMLESKLRSQLLATGMFAAGDAGAGPVARAHITVASEAVEIGAKGEARARVNIRVDTRPPGQPGAISFDVDGNGVEPYAVTKPAPDRAALLTRLVLRIAADLSNDVAARRRLQTGAVQTVHEALVADGGELRQEAIRVVADRKLREEAPVLLKLLNDNDEPTRDAALGALIVLRDRRAVTELTRSRSLRDRREMRKIIEAIAMIGGEEAEQYLSFVAATHDDEEIRAIAEKARARLARRDGAGAAEPDRSTPARSGAN